MTCQNRPGLDEFLTLVYRRISEHPGELLAISVDTIMASETKAITPQEALRKEAEVLERLASVYHAMAVAGGVVESPSAGEPIVTDIPLNRLPVEDAVTSVLRSANLPQKTSQICSALLAANYSFVSESAMRAVHGAIKRLSMRAGADVVYVGGGKWTLASIHTPAKLQKLKEKYSGRGGRSVEEHGRRTREGMIARRTQFGRRPKFGQDHIAKFRQLVEGGMRPLKALEEVGISTAYYYQYKEQIYAWKTGDSWPPPLKKTPPAETGADVIPLRGRTAGDTG